MLASHVASAAICAMETEKKYLEYVSVCKKLGVEPKPRPEPVKITIEKDSGIDPMWALVAFIFGMSL